MNKCEYCGSEAQYWVEKQIYICNDPNCIERVAKWFITFKEVYNND